MTLGFIERILNFFQPYAGQPPQPIQTPFDLASYLINILAVLGTIITLGGVIASIYFFYWTMKTSEKIIKTEHSVDPNINILEIRRYPIEQYAWYKYKKKNQRYIKIYSLVSIGILLILIIIIILIAGMVIEIFFFPQKNAVYTVFNLTDIELLIFSIIVAIIYYLFHRVIVMVQKRYMIIDHKLSIGPAEGSRWMMDRAEMSVLADYNYLLLKARWSLKQIEASSINVKSNSVEGMCKRQGIVSHAMLEK